MDTLNMPGFAAEASLCKTNGRYQSVAHKSYSSGEQGVISQIRISPGGTRIGGTIFEGWLSCAICTGACSLIFGPEAIVECLIACHDSGACEVDYYTRSPS